MDENIQPGAASQEGAASDPAAPVEGTTPTATTPAADQPLTQEQVSKMVQDEVTKATELARREIQSIKDKARSEVETNARRALMAETTLNQVRGKLKDADPAFAEQLEVEELRTFRNMSQQQAQEQFQIQQQAKVQEQFTQNMNQFITGIGVTPTDKRIDWGEDAGNLLDKQSRILASVVKIQQDESRKALEQTSKEFKAMELKLRKDLGLDSVDTSNPSGGARVNKDEAEKLKQRYPSMK